MSAVVAIDKNKVRQSFSSAANSYDELATLQRTVGLELLQKLPQIKISDKVVDIGCGTGFLTEELNKGSVIQQLIAVDIAFSMLQRTRTRLEKIETTQYLCADAEYLPLVNQSVDHIVSNLALQWCQNLSVVFSGFNKALRKDGKLMFSTFGPATLQELKLAWSAVDSYGHVNEFYSAEQLSVFLQQAGFNNVQLETRSYQSEYPSVMALMRELKGIGAHNVLASRNRKTTSKTSMQAMISAYEKSRVNGVTPATYEIIFVIAEVVT